MPTRRADGDMRSFWKYLRRSLPYLRPYWKLAAVSLFVTTLMTGLGLLTPWPMKILIDSVLGKEPLPRILTSLLGPLGGDRFWLLVFVVLATLGLELGANALSVVSNYSNTQLQLGMGLDFRSRMFQHLQRLSLAFHEETRTGGLMYVINSMDRAPIGLIMTVLPLLQNILTLVGMVWICFKIDWQLALLSLTVVPFLYYSVGYYASHIKDRLYQVRGMEGETLSIIHEAMSMLRVIVAFGRETHEYDRFRSQGERANEARVKLTVRQTLFSLAVNSTTALGTAAVLGFGGYHALKGGVTPGELLIILSYISSVYDPLQSISSTVGGLQDQFVNLRIAFDLLDTQPEVQDMPGAISVQRVKGLVAYEGVHFSYKGRANTVKDISFRAQAGQFIALVGPTGAGKTSLVGLLPRFYDPQQGRITIDNVDIRQLRLDSLRGNISIVLQEPLLFSSTIAENIRYGKLDAGMAEIIEAAKAANAHDFIMALPSKYDTVLGERGARLSGGERQRIAVARAFLKDAPILILDEPTSSIDSKTEAVILDALERLMVGRTTFMVAHRLSTIRNADFILVLNHGELVEQGTQQELLQLDGLYKQLFDLQAAQVDDKAPEVLQASVESAG